MDENANIETTFSEADAGAFDAGWDDDPVSAYEEQVSEDVESDTAEEATGSGEDQPATDTPNDEPETKVHGRNTQGRPRGNDRACAEGQGL